ncbi:nucleotidyltransferase [Lithospermum erythrorhizon]|uniref:Nucleotidyltransferase n=1 Tax=Lithospermum erythrorhizon TaxID=34254 RepID=A0AAV3PAF9_LITER
MVLRVKVLRIKAAKAEQKEKLKHNLNPVQISAFDEMLHNVYATRRPKPSDYDVRKDLVRVFNEIAKQLYGNSKVPVVVEFGSFSMDIFDAKSDLDLSVNFGNGSVELPREKKIQTLRKFARKLYALQNNGHVTRVLPITTAKVPILKVVDCGTKVECDISVENFDGILKSRIINLISFIDDRFPKLSFLMKAWAKAHNINSSKEKTLNSLSIVLLVAFHMQTRNPPILPPFSALLKDGSDPESVKKLCRNFTGYGRDNKETLAELFHSLLVKLSAVQILWPKGLCASAYEGSWASKTWDSKVTCISVEDITDRSQNVSRAVGVSEVKIIYKCIQLSLRHLSAFMDGQIEVSRLMELLFGSNEEATGAGTGIPHLAGMSSRRGRKRRPTMSNFALGKRPRAVNWAGMSTESSNGAPAGAE